MTAPEAPATPDPAPANPAQGEPNPEPNPEPAPAKPETDWRAEAKKWEARAKENKSAADKLAEIENANKTEMQRIQERSELAEKRAAELERELVRSRVAVTKKLPAELAERLRGDTAEELAADADALLALMKASTNLKPDLSQGSRGPASPDPAQQFADLIRQKRGLSA